MSIVSTLHFIIRHPLNSRRPVSALLSFLRWQFISRFKEDVTIDWIADSKLVVRRGMTGATGNVYCGLHEFVDMAFVLHMLKPGDLFADIGANVGSYTVLAAKLCRARTLSIEPDPGTMERLGINVTANEIENLVRAEETALGRESGTATFTIGLDTTNQIALDQNVPVREVRLSTLDLYS